MIVRLWLSFPWLYIHLAPAHFTRHNKAPAEAQEKEEEEEDVDMISDSEPIPTRAKPKKKPKKVVPVGRNGLPKKRIVKSKKSKDTRGYMSDFLQRLLLYDLC